MTPQTKAIKALQAEHKLAHANEVQAIKEWSEAMDKLSSNKCLRYQGLAHEASGYTNGILEAIDIIRRLK